MTVETEQKKSPRPADVISHMKTPLPVFVGFSARGPVNKPFEIKRRGQFIVTFGSMKKCGYLAPAASGFFLNGGERFMVLNLGLRPEGLEDVKGRFKEGLAALDALEDIAFIIAPGEYEPSIHEILLDYCEKRDCYALLDGPEELIENVKEASEDEGVAVDESKVSVANNEASVEGEEEQEKYVNLPKVNSSKGLVIYPWIYLKDRVMGDFYIPPTGHIAGIICRLFKEGSNPDFSTIEGTILLRYKFTPEETEQYKDRGISSLTYPTKLPGIRLK